MNVIWDWNGTLLNDVDMAVAVTNVVFAPRGYRTLTREEYRGCFRFPVRDYYRERGIGDDAFEEVAQAWSAGYAEAFSDALLFADAAETVKRFQSAGVGQAIVSASQRDMLQEQVNHFPTLRGRFDQLVGVDDIYAHGKIDLARRYMTQAGIDPRNTVLLGDSCHDAEVARALGCRCILIDRGHQTRQVIAKAGVPIVHSLQEAADMLLAHQPPLPVTERLVFTTLSSDMAEDLCRNSLDAENRRFVPDEVFETEADAAKVIASLLDAAKSPEGPYVLPLLRREDGANIGYVQAAHLDEGWEIGYHIGAPWRGQGYATEAARAALPYLAARLGVQELLGVALEENAASCRVLEKCGMTLTFRGVAPYQGENRPIRQYCWHRA